MLYVQDLVYRQKNSHLLQGGATVANGSGKKSYLHKKILPPKAALLLSACYARMWYAALLPLLPLTTFL